MKKFLFIIIMIMMCSIDVYAAEASPEQTEQYYELINEASKDENAKYVLWYGSYRYWSGSDKTYYTLYFNEILYIDNIGKEFIIERNNDYSYAILVSEGIKYDPHTETTNIIYCPTLYYYDGNQILTCATNVNSTKSTNTSRYTYNNCYDYSGYCSSGTSISHDKYDDNAGFVGSYSRDFVFCDSYGSNVPCFNSYDDMEKYLVNGDYSGATFYPDFLRDYYVDLEVPKNLKVTYSDGFFDINPNYKLTWSQTDPNYVNWQTEFLVYFDFAWRNALLGISFADWNYVKDNFLVNDVVPTCKLKYNLDPDMKYSNEIIMNHLADKGGSTSTVSSYDLYIRNRYVDSSGQLHISNWVRVTIEDGELLYNDSDEENIDISYTEIEGSINTDDDIKKPTGNIITDNGYDGSSVGTTLNQNAADLVGYISNGMGFTGESGLIQLLASVFIFVPDELWIVITAGVSMFVIIGIVKFVRG